MRHAPVGWYKMALNTDPRAYFFDPQDLDAIDVDRDAPVISNRFHSLITRSGALASVTILPGSSPEPSTMYSKLAPCILAANVALSLFARLCLRSTRRESVVVVIPS